MSLREVSIGNSLCSATIVPEEGARVQSIIDRVSGRELLMQRTIEPGPRVEFLESCTGGWDELFPTDSSWEEYPDHGLIWTQAFALTNQGDTSATLVTTLEKPSVRITRSYSVLRSGRRGLRVETTLKAHSDTGPFLWAAHPMLAVTEGWTIELPPGVDNLEVDTDLPGRFDPSANLSRADLADAGGMPARSAAVAEVIYIDHAEEATARSPDGSAATRVAWDSAFFQHLWRVIVTGAYGLDDCLILEPCTTRPYRLEDAIRTGSACSLQSGEELSWWLEVESLDPQS